MLTKFEIEYYITKLRNDESLFMDNNHDVLQSATVDIPKNTQRKKMLSMLFVFCSIFDFLSLKFKLFFPNFRMKNIVYTSSSFTTTVNDVVEDRIIKPLFTDNILFINQSKEIYIREINQQKVYNVGGVAKLLSFFSKELNPMMRYFEGHQKVNRWILKGFVDKEIYLMYYYELNSLSIILSDYRTNLKLVEVQHGSIINYPPYVSPAPLKVIDLFYVKNNATIDYLKEHLCKGFDCYYKLIPYPKYNRVIKNGIHILYASTLEFNGLHPVFLDFLKTTTRKDLHIKIRLHPREQNATTEKLFAAQMNSCCVAFEFDHSKNWLEGNPAANLVVISPWSSILEEAFDNGLTSIIIDKVGAKRYAYLLDKDNFTFTDNLTEILTFAN